MRPAVVLLMTRSAHSQVDCSSSGPADPTIANAAYALALRTHPWPRAQWKAWHKLCPNSTLLLPRASRHFFIHPTMSGQSPSDTAWGSRPAAAASTAHHRSLILFREPPSHSPHPSQQFFAATLMLLTLRVPPCSRLTTRMTKEWTSLKTSLVTSTPGWSNSSTRNTSIGMSMLKHALLNCWAMRRDPTTGPVMRLRNSSLISAGHDPLVSYGLASCPALSIQP
mmetsp:Transcript_17322/g.55578  ORF Transcript_17322/g.55578 Transcript_17322/m.55578 type:complete len:224 (+) Transcript_17322:1049-1720(+)